MPHILFNLFCATLDCETWIEWWEVALDVRSFAAQVLQTQAFMATLAECKAPAMSQGSYARQLCWELLGSLSRAESVAV